LVYTTNGLRLPALVKTQVSVVSNHKIADSSSRLRRSG
jgi:hypothetical protein